MAIEKLRLGLTWPNSRGQCDYRKTRCRGSNACAASGNDWPARYQRRTLSTWRSAGRATSGWKLRRVGNHRDGAELLAWPSLSVEEEKKIREFLGQVAICELTPSIRARAVQLRKEQHLKHAERYRMCDRDGIWGRALDQRHNHRESAGADLSLCQTFGLTQRDWKTETICLASVASNGSGKLSTVFPKSTVR